MALPRDMILVISSAGQGASMPTEMNLDRALAAVRRMPMFRGVSPEDQRRVAALATLREYRRGEYLWRAGDPAEALTLVVSGRVKIVRETEGGGDVILELFGEGEPVGAIAVYNYMPYPASAVCLEPVTLLTLPRRDYFEMLDRHPEFARALIRELTKLVVGLTRKVEEMRGQRVDARVAQLFLSLAGRMGTESRAGVEIRLHLSRQEIADLVGTTAESAIRVMSRWGREGLVVTRQDGFLIPSMDRLQAVAEGPPEG